MSGNYIRPMSKHNQSNNNTNQNRRRQNFSSPNRSNQQQQQQQQTSLSPYPPTRQQQQQQQQRNQTQNRNGRSNQRQQQQQRQQNDYRYEPAMGNNGTIYHRPYHYPTDDRPWAFGPPVYTDEWGNPTNVPVSNWDRAKDMGVDMLEGGMRGMFYAGFRYLERRIFQS